MSGLTKAQWAEIEGRVSVQAIAAGKAASEEDIAKSGGLGSFILAKHSGLMWHELEVRDEFQNDFAAFTAFIQNASRVASHTSKVESYTQDDFDEALEFVDQEEKKAMQEGREALKKRWDSSPALRNEHAGDFESFLAYERNKHLIKSLNTR